MIKLPLFFLFTFFAITPQAQIIEHRVEKYVVEQAIDSFIIYSFSCGGCISFDSCEYETSQYLFWEQNGNYYLKRFDYCKTYKHFLLDTLNPFNFFLKNRKVIDKEEIKQPTYFEVKKNRGKVDSLTVTSTIDHTWYHSFAIPVQRKLEYIYASIYDLDFNEFDNGKKNINYDYNQATKLKALIDLTTTFIEEIKANNKFVIE
ncbi:hypothetical protein [Flavitalea sp.]|nr:hypothetical protein [Flavitalea sp.]